MNNCAEALFCFFVQIGNGNTGGENCVVWMLGGKIGCCFGCQVIQLNGRDAVIDTRDDLLRNPVKKAEK